MCELKNMIEILQHIGERSKLIGKFVNEIRSGSLFTTTTRGRNFKKKKNLNFKIL